MSVMRILGNSLGQLEVLANHLDICRFLALVFFAAFEGEKVQMRRLGKWFLVALGSLLVLLAIVITLTIGWTPFLGPKARALTHRTSERTPQRLELIRYIPTGLSGCVYFHTPHDSTGPGTPLL